MQWTEESRAELRRLWQEGVTTTAIGELLGTSKNAVVGQLHRLRAKLGRREVKQRHAAKGGTLARLPAPRARGAHKRVAAKKPDKRIRHDAVLQKPAPVPKIEVRKTPVSLLEADLLACRWIIGEVDGPRTMYCGHRKLEELSYCSEHARMAFSARRNEAAAMEIAR